MTGAKRLCLSGEKLRLKEGVGQFRSSRDRGSANTTYKAWEWGPGIDKPKTALKFAASIMRPTPREGMITNCLRCDGR